MVKRPHAESRQPLSNPVNRPGTVVDAVGRRVVKTGGEASTPQRGARPFKGHPLLPY